jgi:hypothetical protein
MYVCMSLSIVYVCMYVCMYVSTLFEGHPEGLLWYAVYYSSRYVKFGEIRGISCVCR